MSNYCKLNLTLFISLDFSQAFDTVCHSSLLHKLAQLDLPNHIYNWLSNFYNDSHCTLFHNQQSSLLDITASVIKWSTIGPATYVVTAGDLAATVSGNSLYKFADDAYLIIPASYVASRHIKLANIQNWAKRNNLKLNCDKSCFYRQQEEATSQLNCRTSCATAAWGCWAWSLQNSPSLNTFSNSWRPVLRQIMHFECCTVTVEQRGSAAHPSCHRRRSSYICRKHIVRSH